MVRTAALDELKDWLKLRGKTPVSETTEMGPEPEPAGVDQFVGGPRLAEWLKAEMQQRDHLTRNRLSELSGLDRKTIKKMLAGQQVREASAQKLLSGLSAEGAVVSITDIPKELTAPTAGDLVAGKSVQKKSRKSRPRLPIVPPEV